MAAIDQTSVVGRGSVNFASEKDIDEFVTLLGKFESGVYSGLAKARAAA